MDLISGQYQPRLFFFSAHQKVVALPSNVSLMVWPMSSLKSAVVFRVLLCSTTAFFTPFMVAQQVLANQPNWTESPRVTKALQWNIPAPAETAGKPLTWQTVNPLDQPGDDGSAAQRPGGISGANPTTPDPPSAESGNTAPQSSWIVGIGAGARIGSGEPTYPMVYGRLGRMLDSNIALSLRPRYIFGNSDLQVRSNSEGAFQMPLTLDFKLTPWLSPYLGGGIATNTDSTGKTNGMLSLGADISISRHIAIDLGLNYVFQSDSIDSNGRDLEFTSVLYVRF
jgi:hypothetical protein